MGSIPSTLVIFNLRYFSQFSSLQSKRPNTKKAVKNKLNKLAKLANPSQKLLTFTSIKRWRKFIKRRRKLLKPLLKVKTNVSSSQEMKSVYALWKHYIRTNLNTHRAVVKTKKLVKPLGRVLVPNQTPKTTTRSIKLKLPYKFKMTQFLNSHFNFNKFIIMSKIKKRLKRQKYLGTRGVPSLKHIKRKTSKFILKTFKRRLSLKKAPKFVRAIFLLKKRKALLRASSIKSPRLNQVN